ncbi:MAG: hypothetical protein K1X64_06140 [Myxococcaceae bacterium]|nr:hypothetical protein [Myxococcaceae bacterium]
MPKTYVKSLLSWATPLLCLQLGCASKPHFGVVESPVIENLTPEYVTETAGEQDTGVVRPFDAVELPPLAFTAKVDTAAPQSMPLSALDAVDVSVKLSGAFAGSKVAVEFVAPGDTVYERRETALTGSVFDEQQLSFTLPVAGTLIDSAKLAGTWAARFELDGAELTTQTFELVQ